MIEHGRADANDVPGAVADELVVHLERETHAVRPDVIAPERLERLLSVAVSLRWNQVREMEFSGPIVEGGFATP